MTLLFIDNSDENNFIITNYLPNSKTGLWLAIKDFSNQRVNYYTNESLTFTYWTIIISKKDPNRGYMSFEADTILWEDRNDGDSRNILC